MHVWFLNILLLCFACLHYVQGIKVAFSKSSVPGYTLYDRSRTTPRGADLITSKLSPPPYRDQIRHRSSIRYDQPIENGVYTVRVGFMELGPRGCGLKERLFSVNVNGIVIDNVDIFANVGCKKPYDLYFRNVVVSNGVLRIYLKKISGYAPCISNFETLSSGSTNPPTTTVSTTVTTTTTATVTTVTTAPTTTIPSSTTSTSLPPTTVSTQTTTQVVTTGPSTTVPVTTSSNPTAVDISINVGPQGDVPGSKKAAFYKGSISGFPPGIPQNFFRTSRYGKNFTYTFNLPTGAYDIVLGVIETYAKHCSAPGNRVFNVFVNGRLELEGLDIFEVAGCYTAHRVDIKGVTVGAVDIQPLTITLVAVSNFAQISFLGIQSASEACTPESTTGTVTDDHAAHAVPGSYPPQDDASSAQSYVDLDGNGFHTVQIDGTDSHSHFVDTKNNIPGRIIKYEWSIVETSQIISNKAKFSYNFPLGTTRLKLSVVDNSCATDNAETTVTVTGKMQAGQYCYYYPGLSTFPVSGGTTPTAHPAYASASSSLDLQFPSLPFRNAVFAARCVFFYEWSDATAVVALSAATASSGLVRIYKGADLVYDSSYSSSIFTILSTGLTAFEVLYVYNTLTVPPKLSFQVDGKVPADARVTHDQSTVLPIITSVQPNVVPTSGGTQVKISGYGLFEGVYVSFGTQSVKSIGAGSTTTQLLVKAPAVSSPGTVNVIAVSSGGLQSNSLPFTYGVTTCENVAFQKSELFSSAGGVKKALDFLGVSTVVTLGPDRRLYVGTAIGQVHAIGYDPITLQATTHCSSPRILDPSFKDNGGSTSDRIILGIAFNPLDVVVLPYVSTSTIYWDSKSRIDRSNPAGWRNGAVERLKVSVNPGQFVIGSKSGECLVYDKRIVSNLPVSNRDHSVNALAFNQNGDLLIAVGANTNAGLPGSKLGNLWETPLSGAILIAKTSSPSFNGNVQYSNPDVHFLARKISGDVEVYASGFRNPFALTITRSGSVYAVDQGPNCQYGAPSVACDEFDAAKAATWPITATQNWPGRVPSTDPQCPGGISRRDKVTFVVKDRFYGHPNFARDNPAECAWIDPFNGKSADGKAAPSSYEAPMTLIRSSVTSVNEYRADHFCGALRGDLILSSYGGKVTWRLDANLGNVVSGPDILINFGGIQFTEDEHGLLLFPQYIEKTVNVLQPKVTASATLKVVGVHPWRLRRGGGVSVYIGGYNFVNVGLSVTIGTGNCVVTAVNSRSIVCTAPPYAGGDVLIDVTVRDGGQVSTLAEAVRYMAV